MNPRLHDYFSLITRHIEWTNGLTGSKAERARKAVPDGSCLLVFFTSFTFMTCFCNISFDSAVSCNHLPSFLPLQSLFALTAVSSIHLPSFPWICKEDRKHG